MISEMLVMMCKVGGTENEEVVKVGYPQLVLVNRTSSYVNFEDQGTYCTEVS